MDASGPGVDAERAMAIARSFLRRFWRDDAAPALAGTEDAYGATVWRCTSETAGPAVGQHGRLSFDIDRISGTVTRLQFRRG